MFEWNFDSPAPFDGYFWTLQKGKIEVWRLADDLWYAPGIETPMNPPEAWLGPIVPINLMFPTKPQT